MSSVGREVVRKDQESRGQPCYSLQYQTAKPHDGLRICTTSSSRKNEGEMKSKEDPGQEQEWGERQTERGGRERVTQDNSITSFTKPGLTG